MSKQQQTNPVDSVEIETFSTENNITKIVAKPLGDQTFENRSMPHSSLEPTGIFLQKGDKITITVTEQDNDDLSVWIGLEGYENDSFKAYNNFDVGFDKQSLRTGSNEIVSSHDGVVYLVNESNTATYNATIAGGQNMPVFVSGKTSLTEWEQQLDKYGQVPFVQFIGQRMLGTFQTKTVQENLTGNPQIMLDIWDESINLTDKFYGLDRAANGLHHKNGQRVHLVNPDNSHGIAYASDNGYIGFANQYLAGQELLKTAEHIYQWTLWHEVGHTYQTPQYMWSGMEEVTVNIASFYISEIVTEVKDWVTRDGQQNMDKIATYLQNPNKNYNNFTDMYVKGAMFEQLRWAFGDNFYPNLSQEYRKQNFAKTLITETDEEKIQTFVEISSQIADRDLSEFFEKWGLPVTVETKNKIVKYEKLQNSIWDNIIEKDRIVETIVEPRKLSPEEGTFPDSGTDTSKPDSNGGLERNDTNSNTNNINSNTNNNTNNENNNSYYAADDQKFESLEKFSDENHVVISAETTEVTNNAFLANTGVNIALISLSSFILLAVGIVFKHKKNLKLRK